MLPYPLDAQSDRKMTFVLAVAATNKISMTLQEGYKQPAHLPLYRFTTWD